MRRSENFLIGPFADIAMFCFGFLVALALNVGGCGSTTVVIPPGTVMRLAESTDATVATYDSATKVWIVQGKVSLPAGDYVVPPPATQPSE